MTEQDAIRDLVEAIETIEASWESGDLAGAIHRAAMVKNEICQIFDCPKSAS